jgi:RNA polymerase sigma factor (sigma-70 family)
LKKGTLTREPRNRDYWQFVWSKFRSGDRSSFEEIYNEFTDRLFVYGNKITTDKELVKDAIQDLFIDLYKYHPTIKNPELLEFYLYKSLKHAIIKKLQKENRLQSIQPDFNSFELAFYAETEDFQDDSKSRQLDSLQKALKGLDQQKRELLFLKFDSGLTYSEIGELLNLKPDTVKKQVYRIIQHLHDSVGAKILELFLLCCKT